MRSRPSGYGVFIIAVLAFGSACSGNHALSEKKGRVWKKELLIRASDIETITNFHEVQLENTFLADGFGRKLFFASVPGSGANIVEVFGYTNTGGMWKMHSHLIVRDCVEKAVSYTNRPDGVELFCDKKSIGLFR